MDKKDPGKESAPPRRALIVNMPTLVSRFAPLLEEDARRRNALPPFPRCKEKG